MNLETMTIEEFVAEARKLRADADQAEDALMRFLYAVEQAPRVWESAGMAFASFVEKHHICKASRYLNWRRTRETQGEDGIAGVGVDAVIAAGALRDAAEQSQVIEEARVWQETNGTTISEQSANRLVRDLKQRSAALRTGHRGYTEIAAENERLRLEVERLKTENAALRAELRTLKKKSRAAA